MPSTPKLSEKDEKQLWSRVQSGLAYQKARFHQIYRESLRIYAGQCWPEGAEPDVLVDNRVPVIIRTKHAATTFSYPEWQLTPLDRQAEANQFRAAAAIKYWWRRSQIQEALKSAALWKELVGIGVVSEGWCVRDAQGYSEGGAPLPEKPNDAPSDPAIPEPVVYRPQAPATPAAPLAEDRFAVVALDPIDLIPPAGAGPDLSRWDFVGIRTWRKLEDVKKDARLKKGSGKSGRLALTGTSKPVEEYLPTDLLKLEESQRPADVKMVELLTVWTKDGLKVTFAVESGEALLVEAWESPNPDHPFPVRLILAPGTPRELYRESTPLALYWHQIALNDSVSNLRRHSKTFDRMFQVQPDALDQAAENALMEARPGSVVRTNSPISLVPHPQLQPEVYEAQHQAEQAMLTVTGLSTYQFAAPPTKRMTADESRAIQQAGGVLFYDDTQTFTRLAEEVAGDLLAWSVVYASITREIPVLDDGDRPATWVPYDKNSIKGDFMLEVNVESVAPPNKASQLQDAQLAAQVLLQAAQAANPQTGELPPAVAIVFRLILRLLGQRHVDTLIPPPARQLPAPAAPPPPPGVPPGPPVPPAPPPGPPAGTFPGPGPEGPPPPDQAPGGDPVQQLLASLPPGLVAQLLGVQQ